MRWPKLRTQIGDLDIYSGLLFLVGLWVLSDDPKIGIIILGLAILKQYSGK